MSATCSADLSLCRRYRYDLWRRWTEVPYCMIVGLNPSTADEREERNTGRGRSRVALEAALANASPSVGASTPCQNPGCPHFIVPTDASDERCQDCGHTIRDEEVMCNDADDSTSTRQPVATADTATGASHKRPAKAPAYLADARSALAPATPDELAALPKALTNLVEASKAASTVAGPRSIAARIVTLAQALTLTDAEVGELDVLLDREMNVSSPKLLDWLYGEPPAGCGFPKRFKKEAGRNTDSLARSTDALLATYRVNRDERLRLCLTLIGLKKQISVLNIKTDSDGRVRYNINVAGTKVGRWSVSESNTGSGTNMQTISEPHRHLFPADEGCDLYSIDLRGADGWTIASECVALGDTRMWDDLHAGLKPANAVLLLWNHGQCVNQWPMAQCLDEQAKLDKSHWKYAACKAGIWGTSYGEGDVTLSTNILAEAWKSSGELMYVSAADCKKLQAAVFARYPGIKRRMERINMLLVRDGSLTNCAGFARQFFGRKTDAATQRLAYAYTPAFNTAYANNQALLRLWRDPENSQRIFRPRLGVHDSIVGVAPIDRRDWVKAKIAEWWSGTITVAGLTFAIPAEAKRGPNWGDLTTI